MNLDLQIKRNERGTQWIFSIRQQVIDADTKTRHWVLVECAGPFADQGKALVAGIKALTRAVEMFKDACERYPRSLYTEDTE